MLTKTNAENQTENTGRQKQNRHSQSKSAVKYAVRTTDLKK